MDVSALYPSMSRSNCKIAVKEMILNSELELKHFKWWEAAKYIQEIEAEGLTNVIPKRMKVSSVELTVNCLKAKTDDAWWIQDEPTTWQRRRLIAMVAAAAVGVTMSNYVSSVGDTAQWKSKGIM